MEIKEAQGAVEALLFASGEPLSVERISDVLEIDKKTIIKLLEAITECHNKVQSGLTILNINDQYLMCTKKEFGTYVNKMLEIKRNVPLSPAAMEVLAVVAYNQPVTKAFIEQVRGVDCSGVITTLVEKELICEKGRLELPGRPLLYGTTPNFLRCFNISSLDKLPEIPKDEEDEDEKNSAE